MNGMLLLQPYRFKIIYIKGPENPADYPSRVMIGLQKEQRQQDLDEKHMDEWFIYAYEFGKTGDIPAFKELPTSKQKKLRRLLRNIRYYPIRETLFKMHKVSWRIYPKPKERIRILEEEHMNHRKN